MSTESASVEQQHETGLAVRNAIVVGLSLVATWSVALLVRFVLPRRLAPELFGQYNFADALALNGFAFLNLGIDTYVQKEVPTRPEHAWDFFGGTTALRVVASVVVFVVVGMLAHQSGNGPDVVGATLLFGVANLLSVLSNTCATLLYANRRVGRLSLLNVGTKIVWALALGLAIAVGTNLRVFALALMFSEGLRFVALLHLCRTTLGLRFRIDIQQTRLVLLRSLPFFLNAVAMTLYARIDVSIMGMFLPPKEVGYYGAATSISGIAMMLAPLLSWVLMPQLSRAAAKDREELLAMLRRSFEWAIVFSMPLATFLGVGADLLAQVFGSKYVHSVGAIRALSPIFIAIYLAMLAATALILLNRSWTVTLVTTISLVCNACLNLVLLRYSMTLAAGGPGVVAACISVGVEFAVVIVYLVMIGRDALDGRCVSAFVKSLFITAAVVALDWFLRERHLHSFLRLGIDILVYAIASVATRTARVGELVEMVRIALKNRRSGAAEAPAAS